MHIHESTIGDVRLYVLATDRGGRVTAGAAIQRHGEELWRLDEMQLPPEVATARDALSYAVRIGSEIARQYAG